MPAHKKINGAWTQIAQPWVKDGATWKTVDIGTINEEGDWRVWHVSDATPPSTPAISIEFDESDDARYINVGVRLPDVDHDDELRKIRVLVTEGTDVYPAN